MNGLAGKVAENIVFVLQFAALVFFIFLIAYAVEKRVYLRKHYGERILSTRKLSLIGLFAAVSAVLMVFEVPVPFAPPFYKIDLSELPILIIAFAYGPVAGVMTEFIKILLKLVLKSTSTAFVGELANFTVGCSMVLPASIISMQSTFFRSLPSCSACRWKRLSAWERRSILPSPAPGPWLCLRWRR